MNEDMKDIWHSLTTVNKHIWGKGNPIPPCKQLQPDIRLCGPEFWVLLSQNQHWGSKTFDLQVPDRPLQWRYLGSKRQRAGWYEAEGSCVLRPAWLYWATCVAVTPLWLPG